MNDPSSLLPSEMTVYVASAFGISYNERPTVFTQPYLLSHRIIAYTNFGH